MVVTVGSRLSRVLFSSCRGVHYVQGQSPHPRTREYFYFIDHQGMLFLDDARMKNFTSCFKEKKFLHFFFSRIKPNDTDRYPEFPYISPCGREKNYIRCDDLPVVGTHIIEKDGKEVVSYGHAGDLLTVPFEPQHICMLPHTGRVYHPGPDRVGGVALIKSSLAIHLSQFFHWEDKEETEPPTHFTWKERKYTLSNKILSLLEDNQ